MNSMAPVELPAVSPHSPLFADTGLKLAIFGMNCSAGGALNRGHYRHEIDWRKDAEVILQAEAAGFEAAVPIARWRGFEGESNPWGKSFEPYCWAAGLAAITSRILVFSTSQVLTVSPVMAAKQLATIDHISGGRAGLNVVAGWFEKELRMFGSHVMDHEERYEFTEEWLQVVLRLWREESDFDFSGKWVNVSGAYQLPKPVQRPRPPVMSAAYSTRGHRLAAQYADMVFVNPRDLDGARQQVAEIRSLAGQYGREISVWMAGAVVCEETNEAAQRRFKAYEEDGDEEAISNFIEWTMAGHQLPPGIREPLGKALASSMGAYPLVGDPEHIAEHLGDLADAGIDGICLNWMNYEQGVPVFISEVMPVLEREGIRRPAAGLF
jgi:dimethylsulfone monooxygenase